MLSSIHQISTKELSCDICIIGAGAAGITLAKELNNTKHRVIVLESGGLNMDGPTQKLYEGTALGTFFPPKWPYLSVSRLRYFGGTTNHWTGWVRPLDPLDYESRAWVPHSGWPLSPNDLTPYYLRAAQHLGLEAAEVFDSPHAGLSLFSQSDNFSDRIFQIVPRRFAILDRETLTKSSNIQVILDANLTNITCQQNQRQIKYLEAKSLAGQVLTIKAQAYILACGGIENARLLLNFNRQQAVGLCNASDLVGRFFSDHPHIPCGHLVYAGEKPAERYFIHDIGNSEARLLATISPRESLLRKAQLLNFSVQFQIPKMNTLSSNLKHIGTGFARGDLLQSSDNKAQINIKLPAYSLFLRAEQIPNPNSRVTLNDNLDELGLRKASLDWQVSSTDKASYIKGLELLAREFGLLSKGRVRLNLSPELNWPEGSRGGNHHIGTTRMHHDPKQGVVDAQCRTHEIANLYIAGSSVFPTASCVNPTLTILALAIRLSDYIRKHLKD